MATFADRHQSEFIRAADFHGKPRTFTIESVGRQQLTSDENKTEDANIVIFKGQRQNGDPIKFRMNVTNDRLISAMFGEEDTEWPGKRVTLRPEPDKSKKSEDGLCIRVMGSPDIKDSIKIEIKRYTGPGRLGKPEERTLIPTKTGAAEPMFDNEGGGFDDLGES